MFERFTERARQIIVLAGQEARDLHNDHIGSEHIVLGIFKEEEGLAAKILQSLQLHPEDLSDLIPQDPGEMTPGQIPFSVKGKKALELALREALKLGHNYVGTEHLLLGAICEPTHEINEFFENRLGDKWKEAVRLEVLEALRGPVEKDSELTESEVDELTLKDVLTDLLTGYKMWKEGKIESAEWTDEDEAFSRWVDGSKISEFL